MITKSFRETAELLSDNLSTFEDRTRIWNMDETAFNLNPNGGCVLAEREKAVYSTASNYGKGNVTTVTTFVAINV